MSGPINLGIHWDPNFQNRTEAGFQRLREGADGCDCAFLSLAFSRREERLFGPGSARLS